MTPLRTCLVGLGGFGNEYVDAALDHADELGIVLVGVVDPDPSGCRRLDDLTRRTGSVHQSLEAFYENSEADLVVISAPIHLHAPLAVMALEHGSHVLCEKPVAGVVQDALKMADKAEKAGRTVSIGFQWSFSESIRTIRQEVSAGTFGTPLSLRTLVTWPRPHSYYSRNDWAARLRAPSGAWVLDSPVSNATAHYLHNALLVLGPGGAPVTVQSELYRARDIESFDTAALRVETEGGAEVLFFTTHSVPSTIEPVVHYRFSEADLYNDGSGNFVARFRDGSVREFGNPHVTSCDKLRLVVDGIRNNQPPICSIRDALPHVITVCGTHESAEIAPFPSELICHTTADRGDDLVWIKDLQGLLTQCFAQGLLPTELGGVPWARVGSRVDVRDYKQYPRAAR